MLTPCEVYVDANRDGKIVMANDPNDPANVDANGNPLPVDTTSSAKPFRFWVNNDEDVPGTGSTPETVPATTPDWQSDSIVSQRDLEDWTRLWIYTKGLNTAIKAGTIKVGLKWKNVTGTPGIKIADARDSDGGLEYLTDTTRASAQVTTLEASDVWFSTNITPSGTAADFIFQASTWNNLSDTAPTTHFLFEGTGKGKGQLVVVFLKSDNTEIGEGPSVWLDLHDIKEMYERAIASPQPAIPVGTATPTAPNLTSAPDTTGGTFVPDPDESSTHTYVVFVHGFNQTYAGSTTFAETMFKRLWWRGYKGRFAAFRWPTYGDGTNLGAVGTYNDSEYVAWHSGTALKTFVAGLPSGYAVDIAAHSMGNLVVGEALKEGMTISHYAMLHAATSACCYSNGSYTFPTTDTSGILVPDNDPDPGTSGLAYTRWLGGIGSSPKNFYDTADNVVGFDWDANNTGFKPQGTLTGAYAYQGWQPVGQRLFYNTIIATRYLTDQGEVKAYDDHSLTGAIGHIATTSNGSISSSVNDTSFGNEHSSEWIRNIQDSNLQTFYQTLTGASCFNLQVNP
jgi:hypothetical protein